MNLKKKNEYDSKLSENFQFEENDKTRIGMIVAIELDAFFEYFKNFKELDAPQGFRLFYVEKEHYSLYLLKTGMGEIKASAGVQFLASKCNVSMIVNFGVVGGLTSAMQKQKICLVERVVHYKYDCSEFMDLVPGQVDGHDSIYLYTTENLVRNVLSFNPEIKLVTCCSGDKFVSTKEEKEYLSGTFGGDICDMESAGIVLACEMNSLPCLLIKAVSDGLADGADGFFNELKSASLNCLKISDRIIEKINMPTV